MPPAYHGHLVLFSENKSTSLVFVQPIILPTTLFEDGALTIFS